MDVGNRFDQGTLIFSSVHAVEVGLQGRRTFGFCRLFVDASAIEIADLLVYRAAACATCRCLLQDVMQCQEIALVKFREAHPFRLIGGDLCAFQPGAASVLVKIEAGIDGLVQIVDTETWSWFCRSAGRGG